MERGKIDKDLRDDFGFSAKTPATETKLNWKAYQTFDDGNVVAWDQETKKEVAGEKTNPYSITEVAVPKETKVAGDSSFSNILPLIFSLIAVALSGFTVFAGIKKTK